MKRSEPSGGLGRATRLARRSFLSFFPNPRAWSQATQSVLEVEFSTTDKWNHLVVGPSETRDLRIVNPAPWQFVQAAPTLSLLLFLLLLLSLVLIFVSLCC